MCPFYIFKGKPFNICLLEEVFFFFFFCCQGQESGTNLKRKLTLNAITTSELSKVEAFIVNASSVPGGELPEHMH